MRRTGATTLTGRYGVTRFIVGMVLGHTPKDGAAVTAVYDRYTYVREKREALLKWAGHLTGVPTGLPEAEVNQTALIAERAEALDAARRRALALCTEGRTQHAVMTMCMAASRLGSSLKPSQLGNGKREALAFQAQAIEGVRLRSGLHQSSKCGFNRSVLDIVVADIGVHATRDTSEKADLAFERMTFGCGHPGFHFRVLQQDSGPEPCADLQTQGSHHETALDHAEWIENFHTRAVHAGQLLDVEADGPAACLPVEDREGTGDLAASMIPAVAVTLFKRSRRPEVMAQ